MTTIYVSSDKYEALPKRRDYDFYPTPRQFCDKALRLVELPEKGIILDAGAGTGVWGQAYKNIYPKARLFGIDVRELPKAEKYDFWETADFLNTTPLKIASAVVGNPPYNKAEEFIYHSFEYLQDGGKLVLLLRLAFLESAKRYNGLWAEHRLQKCFVSASRVSYTGDGKTDATAYAVFVWQKGWTGTTELDWFDWKQ